MKMYQKHCTDRWKPYLAKDERLGNVIKRYNVVQTGHIIL